MSRYRSKPYRYPQWPLFRQTTNCFMFMIPGMVLLMLPLGWVRLIGLFPIGVSLVQWHFQLHPKWEYIIRVDPSGLKIRNHLYKWDALNQLQIQRNGNHRILCLGTPLNPKEVLIKDDIPRFEDLAQECYWYMSRLPDTETVSR